MRSKSVDLDPFPYPNRPRSSVYETRGVGLDPVILDGI